MKPYVNFNRNFTNKLETPIANLEILQIGPWLSGLVKLSPGDTTNQTLAFWFGEVVPSFASWPMGKVNLEEIGESRNLENGPKVPQKT